MTVTIRQMTAADIPAITVFFAEAADYYVMAEGHAPGPTAAQDFFTDCPPGCDPTQSLRLGLFVDDRLSGLLELSFGFPAAGDAYLGLMILAPRIRGKGHGRALLAAAEDRARATGAPVLYLAVLAANTRGRAFWDREGFLPTGVSRVDNDNGLNHVIHRLMKPL